jgi:hypothetical protein
VAALIFATLGIALALHGKRVIRARALNISAVGTSVLMNALAAAPGWRAAAIWIMPPVAYALASDTAIGVVRAWTIARARALNTALADDEATPLALLGGLMRWLFRLAVAPASTLAGFRAWVVQECPVAPGRRARPAPASARPSVAEPGAKEITARSRAGRSRGGARDGTKTARFLALAAGPVRAARRVPVRRRLTGQRRTGLRGRPAPRRRTQRAAPPRPRTAEREPPVNGVMQHFPAYFATLMSAI